MLTLYSKETTSFSTLGIGVLRDFISHPLITEELNGAYTLEFEYAKDGYLSEYLVEQNIIKANGQAFRIWNIKKDMQKITVFAKHIFFDLSFNFLADVFPTNLTAQSALAWMLNRAAVATNFSATGNCTQTASTRYVRKNFIDAVFNEDNALLKKFGGELSYDNFNITVHEHRGTNANFSIRYKKNLTGIDFNLDFSNVATRIVPIGFDGLTIDSTYVESPRASNYFTPLYKTYEFNDIKYDPDDEEAYHTLAEAKQALINAANDLFTKNVDLPQVSISVNFVELSKCSEYASYSNLETVHLGDTIDVIIPELNIHTSARVNKTVYDCILDRFITLEIGSAKQSIARTQIVIENQIRKSENYLTQAQQNAENLINHPFNGNVYIDKENGVIYLMDSTSPATAQNVWKWSLGGLGFSSTGINGTYTVAILQDGRINADFITTGQLNTGVIQGYDSLLIQVDTLDREFQKEINPTDVVSGSSITLEDSAEAELIDFEVEGKTEQDHEPTPDYPSELVSVGYQNLTQLNNYTNNVSNVYFVDRKFLDNFENNTTYTLSFDITSNVEPFRISIGYGNNSFQQDLNTITDVYNGHVSIKFTTNNTTYSNLWIRAPRYVTPTTYQTEVKNMILVKGQDEKSYIPYGKYGIEVKTTGKNIWNEEWGNGYYNRTSGAKGSGSNYIRSADYIPIKPNTSIYFNKPSDFVNYAVLFYDSSFTKLGGTTATNTASQSFTSPSNASYFTFYGDTGLSNATYQNNIIITKGTQATEYEEYKGKTYLYTLDNPLRSIGDTKDLLYIKNGMLYVERYIRHLELSIANMNNNEDYPGWKDLQQLATDYPSANAYLKTKTNYMSNIMNGQDNNIGINTVNNNKILYFEKKYFNLTQTQWKTNYPDLIFNLDYELAEPYTEELGEVQIPSTYKGITHIDTTDELEPNMNITYVRDTLIANYVESHVSELKINEQGIEARVETIEESDYGGKINRLESSITSQEARLDILSTNIDTTTGEVREVTTSNGLKFNSQGLNLYTGQDSYNTLINNVGTYYKDGDNVISETTKDGFMATNSKNKGQHSYSYDETNDLYEFIDERVEADGEYCYATFYNGEE